MGIGTQGASTRNPPLSAAGTYEQAPYLANGDSKSRFFSDFRAPESCAAVRRHQVTNNPAFRI